MVRVCSSKDARSTLEILVLKGYSVGRGVLKRCRIPMYEGRNHLALQSSRFSHDCESLMRCTRVTQECRRRRRYSVERANQAASVFSPFQAFTRRICSGYGSAMLGRAIAVRVGCSGRHCTY